MLEFASSSTGKILILAIMTAAAMAMAAIVLLG